MTQVVQSVQASHQRVVYTVALTGGGLQVLEEGGLLGGTCRLQEVQGKERGSRETVRCVVLHLERGVVYLQEGAGEKVWPVACDLASMLAAQVQCSQGAGLYSLVKGPIFGTV